MNNNQLAEVAKILGVSEDSISAMNDEIKNSMTAVFETVAIRNDEDKKIVFEALDDLWQKGSVYIGLDEVAKSTGTQTPLYILYIFFSFCQDRNCIPIM